MRWPATTMHDATMGVQAAPWASSVRLASYRPRTAMPVHTHAAPVLCLVVAGCYEERIRGRSTSHRAGHLLYCPAHEPHAQQFSDRGALKVLLSPSAATIDYLKEHVTLSEAPAVECDGTAELGARFAAELRLRDDFSQLAVQGLVLETIAAYSRTSADARPRAAPWLREARSYIDAHIGATFHVGELAREVGRHPVHVSRAFRRAFGLSIGEYTRKSRARQAAHMLVASDRSIAEIAAQCGFCDQAHMTRSFASVFGMTPGRFRGRMR